MVAVDGVAIAGRVPGKDVHIHAVHAQLVLGIAVLAGEGLYVFPRLLHP